LGSADYEYKEAKEAIYALGEIEEIRRAVEEARKILEPVDLVEKVGF
jgi:hypothetical protein